MTGHSDYWFEMRGQALVIHLTGSEIVLNQRGLEQLIADIDSNKDKYSEEGYIEAITMYTDGLNFLLVETGQGNAMA